jgi:hypothetical protein
MLIYYNFQSALFVNKVIGKFLKACINRGNITPMWLIRDTGIKIILLFYVKKITDWQIL